MERVKDEKEKSGHQDSNGLFLQTFQRRDGFDRIKPIQMYINKLVHESPSTSGKISELEKEGRNTNKTALDNQLTHSNRSRGYFTRTKSQSSKGKISISSWVRHKKEIKGIDHQNRTRLNWNSNNSHC